MSLSRLFLIDAHALCYRSFFAIKGLINSKGQATNAVYGFTNALKKMMREHQPEYLAVCFDMKGKTRRQEKFAEYKIQRPVMPDDLISQIPLIRQVIAAYNIPILEKDGYEADDIIATIARRLVRPDLETVIVSDDKDMFQLVGDKVKILSTRQEDIMGRNEVENLLGFSPDLIPDYIALAGDSVDNIPGVKGIGEVSAKNLIKSYGRLENILKKADEVKPDRVKLALTSQKDAAVLCKELALLEDNADISVDLESMRVVDPDTRRLKELFTELEFRKFAAELDVEPEQRVEQTVIKPVKTAADLKKLVELIEGHGSFSFSCEACAEGEIAPPQYMFVCAGTEDVYQVPLDDKNWFIRLFENKKIVKITHDVKCQLRNAAWQPSGAVENVFDTMLAGYLVSPARADYSLTGMAWEYLKLTVPEDTGEAQKAKLAADLYQLLDKRLKEHELSKLFVDLEMPLAFVLLRMEKDGVKLDETLLSRLSVETAKKIDALVKDIYRLAGEEFNLNSPKQLSEILFQKLKLPAVKKTKTGFSTDEGVLVNLSEEHEMPAKLLEYRQLAKLKSTYIDALPKLVNHYTGKLHASFNQAGAETGRLSSTNPNLQNIPIRTELGRQIRAAFIPSAKDRVIIAVDYSQIELRILAHLSGDENLSTAFKKGEDIHSYTAAQILEVDEKDLTDEMRNRAKRVNFGIIYGMSAFGLSKDLGINQREAQDFIDRYFLRYPKVKGFMDAKIEECRELGYVTTMLHRRRYIPEINSSNIGVRQFAERQAINTPVQGSAADMIKLAMVDIDKELREKKFASRMIITVHDELVFDVLASEEKELVKMIRDKMENTMKLSVPVVVSVKKGKNWLEMERI